MTSTANWHSSQILKENMNTHLMPPSNAWKRSMPAFGLVGGFSNICQTCKLSFPDAEKLQKHYRIAGHQFYNEFYTQPLAQTNHGAPRQQYDHFTSSLNSMTQVGPLVNFSSYDQYPMLQLQNNYGLNITNPNIFAQNPGFPHLQQNTSQQQTVSYSQHQQFDSKAQSSAPFNVKLLEPPNSTYTRKRRSNQMSTQIKYDSEDCEVQSVKLNVPTEINTSESSVNKPQKSIDPFKSSVEREQETYNFRLETDRVLRKLIQRGEIEVKISKSINNEDKSQSTYDSHASTDSEVEIKKRRTTDISDESEITSTDFGLSVDELNDKKVKARCTWHPLNHLY